MMERCWNNELERILKEAVVAKSEVGLLFWDLSGGT
jgi:hypothetical protein